MAATLVLGFVQPATAEIGLPPRNQVQPIVIQAERATQWIERGQEVWVLEGGCRILQGNDLATSHRAVLWIERAGPMDYDHSKVIAYLEGQVEVNVGRASGPTRLTGSSWLGHFLTCAAIQVDVPSVQPEPEVKPALYRAAVTRRFAPAGAQVRPAQFTQPLGRPNGSDAEGSPPASGSQRLGAQRISLHPRSNVPYQIHLSNDERTGESVAVIDSGVNLIVQGIRGGELEAAGVSSIDVEADRLVIWTANLRELVESGQAVELSSVPFEIYMEGNIIFQAGDRVIFAERLYYDVRAETGVVLDAELYSPVPDYEGLIRLRAQVLHQTSPTRFFAKDAFLTSSRMGRPGYRIQTGDIEFIDHQRPQFNPVTGEPIVHPDTLEPMIDHDFRVRGRNNFLYINELPVFWWPVLTSDLHEPTFYIRRVRMKNDSVFGTQLLTDWNAYQLFGIEEKPLGTEWDISLDYLSDRGLGHGTEFSYDRNSFLSMGGPTLGNVDLWGIHDTGLDNLGRGRRGLVPEKDYRHRLYWRHRQELAPGMQLSAEIGWISDRNFLEQYYEREWDEQKDQTTGLELRQSFENLSWSVTADKRLNLFFTQTEWLPRADHFWLGQSLLGDLFTWYEHTHVGYGKFRTADRPEDPADAATFSYLPWELDAGGAPLSRQGERFVTRQEIDLPLQLGHVKFVPYALGEAGHWGEDVMGDDLQRLYGQVGVRASMPMWRVDPNVENTLLNVHGLAHKVVFDAELSHADANHDLTELPLYDPLDDDSIEAFRRRFLVTTFGGGVDPLPARFDERFYALRSGLAGWVTSPATEIADDMTILRLGMRHRWQTKRGRPGERRILDWVTLDTHATWFPKDEENFGTNVGLVDYDLRWHVGDRLTLLSDGAFDFFDSGQQLVNFGGFLTRPPKGSLYVGMHLLEGPISSSILSMSYSYRMSPKWVSSLGMSFDMGGDGNIGQNFQVTRIGESFLVSFGVNVDASRGNVGAHFAIEPRFLPKTQLGQAGGARIPPAGAFGLE